MKKAPFDFVAEYAPAAERKALCRSSRARQKKGDLKVKIIPAVKSRFKQINRDRGLPGPVCVGVQNPKSNVQKIPAYSPPYMEGLMNRKNTKENRSKTGSDPILYVCITSGYIKNQK
jgi:hypothetical protein